MISLRRHVLTLVAVFLALAIGVVLGSTTVTTSIHDALVDRQESTAAQLEQALAERDTAERQAERLDGLAAAVRPVVTDKVLDKRPVLMLLTPGVDEDTAKAVRTAVTEESAFERNRSESSNGTDSPPTALVSDGGRMISMDHILRGGE